MATQREFEAAAERRAVQHGHDRLREPFDRGDAVAQRRRRRRLAELGNIRAGHEGPAGTDEHRTADRRVGRDRRGGRHETRPHGLPGRVDGRVVDREDRDVVAAVEGDGAVVHQLTHSTGLVILPCAFGVACLALAHISCRI